MTVDGPHPEFSRFTVWTVLWGLAAGTAITGLIVSLVVIRGLWPFGGHAWPVLLFLFLPVAVPTLTVSQRPGMAATVFALLAAVGVVVTGLVCFGLLTWAEAHDWQGDRCCDAVFATPWSTWQVLMLVYSGLGVVLLAVLIVALRRVRRSGAQAGAAPLEAQVS